MSALAITGSAMLASIGPDRASCFDALCAGRSGHKPFLQFDPARFKVQNAYEIDDREQRGSDVVGRASRWLGRVVAQALSDANLSRDETRRIPVIVGTGLRELRSAELWFCDGAPLALDELHFTGAVRRASGSSASIVTISNACSAGNFCLAVAADMLTLGEADAVIVAATDSLTESMVGLADRANPLIPDRLRPFDKDRRGVMLGEGSAAVVLESLAGVERRGVRPMGWLRGVGTSCDAHHETAPDVAGIAAAMRDAHRRSGLGPAEIDVLLAHGTGTALNDEAELRAFREVFGEHAERTAISGLKSMTGHTSGASALIGVVVGVECLRRGRVPPTAGLEAPLDIGCGLHLVRGEAEALDVRAVQVNAFGFGGVNAVAVIEAVN